MDVVTGLKPGLIGPWRAISDTRAAARAALFVSRSLRAKNERLPLAGFLGHPGAMQKRPGWQAPRINYPKGVKPIPPAMAAKRTPWTVFSPESNRRQCVSISKHSQRRCRCPAVQGADQCRVHGGLAIVLSKLKRQKIKVMRPARLSQARRLLFAAGLEAPEGCRVPDDVKGVARGRFVEAYRNRLSGWTV